MDEILPDEIMKKAVRLNHGLIFSPRCFRLKVLN